MTIQKFFMNPQMSSPSWRLTKPSRVRKAKLGHYPWLSSVAGRNFFDYSHLFRGIRLMIGTAPRTSPSAEVETTSQSYRAFLSYSHRDSAWGNWIHGALEAYRVPKELVGRATPRGQVPAKLRPIFRDRFDLAASHALSKTIDAALAGSENLIVLCSPASAKS